MPAKTKRVSPTIEATAAPAKKGPQLPHGVIGLSKTGVSMRAALAAVAEEVPTAPDGPPRVPPRHVLPLGDEDRPMKLKQLYTREHVGIAVDEALEDLEEDMDFSPTDVETIRLFILERLSQAE